MIGMDVIGAHGGKRASRRTPQGALQREFGGRGRTRAPPPPPPPPRAEGVVAAGDSTGWLHLLDPRLQAPAASVALQKKGTKARHRAPLLRGQQRGRSLSRARRHAASPRLPSAAPLCALLLVCADPVRALQPRRPKPAARRWQRLLVPPAGRASAGRRRRRRQGQGAPGRPHPRAAGRPAAQARRQRRLLFALLG